MIAGVKSGQTIPGVLLEEQGLEIRANAFQNQTSLKYVLSVRCQKINGSAFMGCSNLEYASFPSLNTTPEPDAFKGCPLKCLYIGKTEIDRDVAINRGRAWGLPVGCVVYCHDGIAIIS